MSVIPGTLAFQSGDMHEMRRQLESEHWGQLNLQ